MQEQKVIVQRWPFEVSSAHVCEACDYVCAPYVTVCPKCRTVLGEFSRPVKIDAVAAAAMATAKPDPMPGNQPWDVNPAPAPASGVRRPGRATSADPAEYAALKSNEILTRCPHCDGILGVSVRGA